MSDFPVHALTWTGLLGHWLEYARASTTWTGPEGAAWREAVPTIIRLQAVTFALEDLARLPRDERAWARDKADVLIEQSVAELRAIWSDGPLPDEAATIVETARNTLDRSIYATLRELIHRGTGPLVVPSLVDLDAIEEAGGTLSLMMPGTIAMPGEPIGWWADRDDLSLPDCVVESRAAPRQVYRQIDDTGMIERDLIAPLDDLPPGMPLIVPLLADGLRIGRFTMDATTWEARQRGALRSDHIEVVEANTDSVPE